MSTFELMGFVSAWTILFLSIIFLIVGVTARAYKFFERRLPHVGEVWEDRKVAHPWVKRNRVEITDVREGWLKYKTIDPQRWSYDPDAIKMFYFMSLFRKSKNQTKSRIYHIGCDFGSPDLTAIILVDRPTMPKAWFDFTPPKSSRKILKKIINGKYSSYSVGSKKAGKK